MVNKLKSLANTEEKKRLLSNFFSLAILQGANYILPLITFPYLVKVLGVEKFGILAFATAVIAYFSLLIDYGFNLTATREVSIYRDNKKKLNEIFNSIMCIKFILIIISLVILTILILAIEKFKEHWIIFYLTFGTVIGQALFPQWFFQGIERMKYITFLNILSKVVFTIAIFIFVHSSADLYKVPLINSFGFLIAGLLGVWIVIKDFKIRFYFPKYSILKFYFKDGWHIFIATFAGNFYRNFNILVLGFLTNNLFVGYYSIAEKIIKIIQSLQTVIGNVLFPYFSNKIKNNKKFFFQINEKYNKLVYFIYILVSFVLFLFSPLIVYLVKGDYESHIILDLRIMSIVIFIGGLNYYYGVLGLITMGYKKEFSKAIIYTGIFNIIISFMLVYFFKDIGASLSLVFSEMFLLIILLKLKYYKKLKNEYITRDS